MFLLQFHYRVVLMSFQHCVLTPNKVNLVSLNVLFRKHVIKIDVYINDNLLYPIHLFNLSKSESFENRVLKMFKTVQLCY